MRHIPRRDTREETDIRKDKREIGKKKKAWPMGGQYGQRKLANGVPVSSSLLSSSSSSSPDPYLDLLPSAEHCTRYNP
jgi:hypothetical protein